MKLHIIYFILIIKLDSFLKFGIHLRLAGVSFFCLYILCGMEVQRCVTEIVLETVATGDVAADVVITIGDLDGVAVAMILCLHLCLFY